MSKERIKLLAEKVKYCLNKFPDSRNDDTLLTYYIIATYLPDEIEKKESGKVYISYEAMGRIREDHVKRVRAKIQNEEHKYLPTDPIVRKKRKISEAYWHQWSLEDRQSKIV